VVALNESLRPNRRRKQTDHGSSVGPKVLHGSITTMMAIMHACDLMVTPG
jgi:hypothetical protein